MLLETKKLPCLKHLIYCLTGVDATSSGTRGTAVTSGAASATGNDILVAGTGTVSIAGTGIAEVNLGKLFW